MDEGGVTKGIYAEHGELCGVAQERAEALGDNAFCELKIASFAFALPKRKDVCVLSIYRVEGDERIEVIEAQEISPGTASFFLDLTGTGTHIYEVYIDGELYKTQDVVFT